MDILGIDVTLAGLKRGAAKFGTRAAAVVVKGMSIRVNGFAPEQPEPYGDGQGGPETAQAGGVENASEFAKDMLSFEKFQQKSDSELIALAKKVGMSDLDVTGDYDDARVLYDVCKKKGLTNDDGGGAGAGTPAAAAPTSGAVDSSKLGYQSAQKTTTFDKKKEDEKLNGKLSEMDKAMFAKTIATLEEKAAKESDPEKKKQLQDNAADLRKRLSRENSSQPRSGQKIRDTKTGEVFTFVTGHNPGTGSGTDYEAELKGQDGQRVGVIMQDLLDELSSGKMKLLNSDEEIKENAANPYKCQTCDWKGADASAAHEHEKSTKHVTTGGKVFEDPNENALKNDKKCPKCNHDEMSHFDEGKLTYCAEDGKKVGPGGGQKTCGCEGSDSLRKVEGTPHRSNAGSEKCSFCDAPAKFVFRGRNPSDRQVACADCAKAKNWNTPEVLANAGHLGPESWELGSLEERAAWLERAGQDINLATSRFVDLSLDVHKALQDAVDMPANRNLDEALDHHPNPGTSPLKDRLNAEDAPADATCPLCFQTFSGMGSEAEKKMRAHAVKMHDLKENADGRMPQFIFKDGNGESHAVFAKDESAAWEQLSKDFATPVSDIKGMGVKLDSVKKNSLPESGICTTRGCGHDAGDHQIEYDHTCLIHGCGCMGFNSGRLANADTEGDVAQIEKLAEGILHETGEIKEEAAPLGEPKDPLYNTADLGIARGSSKYGRGNR